MKSSFMKKLVYLCIISYIVFGNALTFNIGQRLPLKLAEIISIFVMILFLFDHLSTKIRLNKTLSKLNNWVIWWIIIAILSCFINFLIIGYSLADVLYGLLYVFRIIHVLLFVVILLYYIKKSNIKFESITNCIVISFLVVCLIGFIQLVLFPIAIDWYNLFYKIGVYWETPDPHKYRLISTYFDPNYLASILVIPFSIVLCRLTFLKEKKIKNLLYLMIFILAIILTKSRSGIVGLATSLFVFALCFGVQRKIPISVLVLIVSAIPVAFYLVFFSNIEVFERIRTFATDPSAMHRFDSWADSLKIFMKYPFVGIGYNMYGAFITMIEGSVASASGYGVDSSLLFILITTGIVGGMIFLYGIIKLLSKKSLNFYMYSFKMIIFSSCIISFFNNLLFNVLWIFPVALIGLLLLKTRGDYNENSLPFGIKS